MMVRFFAVICYPLDALLSLFAFVFWMICWAIWQCMRGMIWVVQQFGLLQDRRS